MKLLFALFIFPALAFAAPFISPESNMQLEYSNWIKSQAITNPAYKNIILSNQKEDTGFPDVEILLTRWPMGRSRPISGYFLEFKVPFDPQTRAEIEWQQQLLQEGYLYYVVYSAEEAKNITQEYIALPPVLIP